MSIANPLSFSLFYLYFLFRSYPLTSKLKMIGKPYCSWGFPFEKYHTVMPVRAEMSLRLTTLMSSSWSSNLFNGIQTNNVVLQISKRKSLSYVWQACHPKDSSSRKSPVIHVLKLCLDSGPGIDGSVLVTVCLIDIAACHFCQCKNIPVSISHFSRTILFYFSLTPSGSFNNLPLYSSQMSR